MYELDENVVDECMGIDKLIDKLESIKYGNGNLDNQMYRFLVEIGYKIGIPFKKSPCNYTTNVFDILDILKGNKYMTFFVTMDSVDKKTRVNIHFIDFVECERALGSTSIAATTSLALCAGLLKAFKQLKVV